MDFYTTIAKHYDDIFPLDEAAPAYIRALSPPPGPVLDAGCATGSLAIKLAAAGYRVQGIDLDQDLIRIAQAKAAAAGIGKESLSFRALDMRQASLAFEPGAYSLLLCLGNTLPHLLGPREIADALSGFRRLLRPGGRILLQLINFQRIIEKGIKGLPCVENDKIKFERDYQGIAPNRPFRFATRLWVKPEPQPLFSSVELFPLYGIDLDSILAQCGFVGRAFHADFSGAPAKTDSVSLIVSARRE